MKNLIKVTLGVVALGLVACGKVTNEMSVAPEAAPYVNEFLNQAALHGVSVETDNLTIVMASPEEVGGGSDSSLSTALGRCNKKEKVDVLKTGDLRKTRIKTIYINATTWKFAEKNYKPEKLETFKKELIFHELGHCLLNRGHLDTKMMNWETSKVQNKSLMSTYSQAVADYSTTSNNWQYYVNELFGQ